MPFDFEALVGHLYVVGGRAVSIAPPGALVEVAPTKAARGREADTIFLLVLPSGDMIAPPAFYEQMAQLAAERYFDSTGSVTAGLREVFQSLNDNLIEHNNTPGNRVYEANLVCAVLRADDLIVARMGSGIALMNHISGFETQPPDLNNDDQLYIPPLGVQTIIDVKMTRHKVTNGSRLVLGDSNLSDFSREQLQRVVFDPDIAMALVAFKELARLQLTLLIIEFVPPEVPAPVPVPEGESSAAIAAAKAAASKGGTRSKAEGRPARVVNGRSGKVVARVGYHAQRTVGTMAGGVSRGLSVTHKAIDHYFGPTEDEKTRWYTTRLATGAAVLIPVLIVAAVLGLWLLSTGESEFELCLQDANNLAQVARDVPSSNPTSSASTWNAVLNASRRCDDLRAQDPTVLALIREAQVTIDAINQIERREIRTLAALPDVSFSRIVVNGYDIYVLDRDRQVYRGRINEQDGLSLSRQLAPIPDMRNGANVNGFPVEGIFDIAVAGDSVYAMSRNGVMVRCEQRISQSCNAQRLILAENWQNPTAITIWGVEQRLYVLDPGTNQVWRYERSNDTYGQGTEWFSGQNQAAITNAVDFAILSGTVYVLLADGTLMNYDRGVRQPFAFGGFPDNAVPPAAQSLYLDDNPISQGFYITNRETGTIYHTTVGGTWQATYRIFDEPLFATLAGVATDPNQRIIYAISGNAVFALER
jgi:hypothetical protein